MEVTFEICSSFLFFFTFGNYVHDQMIAYILYNSNSAILEKFASNLLNWTNCLKIVSKVCSKNLCQMFEKLHVRKQICNFVAISVLFTNLREKNNFLFQIKTVRCQMIKHSFIAGQNIQQKR